MGTTKKIRQTKGITLIALVVTIVILIILASISISVTINENGFVPRAQNAKFATEIAQCKEDFDLKKLTLEMNGNMNLYDLKEQLEKQVKSLQIGQTNAIEAVEMIGLAEGELSEIHAMLQRMFELIVKMMNGTVTETDKTYIKREINELVMELNRVADEIGTKKHVVEFSDGYFNQGNIEFVIEDVHFEKIYGADEINYSNIEEVPDKINEAIRKISKERSKLGANQNALEDVIEYENALQESITNIHDYIFYSDVINKIHSSEEEAIKKAKSWGTTIKYMDLAKGSISAVHGILKRMIDVIPQAEQINNQLNTDWIQGIQGEIDAGLLQVKNILTYAGVGDKKVFTGHFPYVQELTLKSLGIESISVMSIENATKSHEKVTKAIQTIENISNQLSQKQEELAVKENEPADKEYAFDVFYVTANIPEGYQNKLRVINGELTYIGNDKAEKEIAKQVGIKVEE